MVFGDGGSPTRGYVGAIVGVDDVGGFEAYQLFRGPSDEFRVGGVGEEDLALRAGENHAKRRSFD